MTRCIAAAALLALLTAGCVTQPVDPAALEQELGAGAGTLTKREARQAVQDARAAAGRARQGSKRTTTGTKDGGEGGTGGREAAPSGGSGDDGERTDDSSRNGSGGVAQRDARPRARRSGGGGGSPAVEDRGQPRGRTPSPPPPGRTTLREVVDPADDPTGNPPAYADVRQVLVESDGAQARLTVAFAGAIPAALGQGEVQGVGVDLYRSDQRESDYQLFADGGSDGWTAFLHTPQGIVTYPGTFRLGGRVMIFEVPWSALGGKRNERLSMFVDWSQEQPVLNKVGNDRAPDSGTVAIAPR